VYICARAGEVTIEQSGSMARAQALVGRGQLFLGLPRGVRKPFGPVLGDLCVDRSSSLGVQVLSCSALFLPCVPLPLLEVREAINAQQRDGAVILMRVMQVKVDANVPIKVAN
jgi:hypothetical protein